PESPGLLLPGGDRRRNLPLLPGRAGAARRQYARGAGGAEPGAAHLYRGGRGGAADHRDGAGRDDRLGRALRHRQARPRACRRPPHLTGTALNDGIALGHVVLHEPRVVITNFIADDVPKEIKRLEAAVETMRSDLDVLLERGEVADGGEHRDVLEAYRMFAYDRGWVHRLEEAVATGLTAEAAVERVQSDTRARMLRATDPYLRERLHDLDELANRLMHQLLGQDYAPARDRLPDNAVLVARSMGPAA